MTTAPAAPPAPDPADVQAAFAATLVDEWGRAGLTDAVVCPGSRSTPLALALADAADEGRLRLHVHHDERSGAFVALGLGLASGRPALVLTTSGTAAAELHPAVVEAGLAEVPLLVCTADRPPELRDVGAPQAVDQVHLFGRAVRWYADPGVPDRGGRHGWRAFASRAYAAAAGGAAPGPVHLNLPFREPLVGAPADLPPARPGGRPWVRAVAGGGGAAGGPGPELADLAADLVGRRGIIVAGASGGDGGAAGGDLGTLVHGVAAALGWPVVADPRSAAWRPAGTLVPHLDAVLRAPAVAGGLRPEVVVRLGPPGASRVVDEWLAASGAVEVVAGAPGWSDPASTAAAMVGRATPLLAALAAAAPAVEAPAGWLATWSAAAEAARAAAEGELGPGAVVGGPPVEPAVARAVVGAVAPGTALVVSSSMPIRDVERYAVPRGDVRVLANRGANGIDGVVSTAVGVALAWGGPASLLVGDLAFLHDSNGLLGAAGRGIDLACVVVDNDGGGIFSFLPQARALAGDRFEALFGTPHGLDLVAVASAFGVAARRIDAGEDVAAAVTGAAAAGGVRVLVVPTDRAANVEAHRRVDDAIAAAVQAAVGG